MTKVLRGRFIEKARSRAFYLKERALVHDANVSKAALSTFHKNSSVRIRDLTARSLVPSSALAIYPRLVKLAPRIPKTINARFHSGQWGERRNKERTFDNKVDGFIRVIWRFIRVDIGKRNADPSAHCLSRIFTSLVIMLWMSLVLIIAGDLRKVLIEYNI